MEFWRLGKIVKVIGISAIVALWPVHSSQAQDASFPCKVLLCAAATNPSWTQIPYCVPIMHQAIYMQAWRIAVGVCAEAQSSGQSARGPKNLLALPQQMRSGLQR